VAAFGRFVGALALLCATMEMAHAAIALHGTVRDSSGAPVADAAIVLATAKGVSVAVARSDGRGDFTLDAPAAGTYLVIITARGFQEVRRSVRISESGAAPFDIVLAIGAVSEDVTVTAAPAFAQDVRVAGQPVNIISATEIQERVKTVVAEAVMSRRCSPRSPVTRQQEFAPALPLAVTS
jgi:hypothetical protein